MGKGRGVDARTASFFAAVLTASSAAIISRQRAGVHHGANVIHRARAGLLRHLRRHQVPARTRNLSGGHLVLGSRHLLDLRGTTQCSTARELGDGRVRS